MKEQLVSVLPLLLVSQEVVVYTYAAVTLNRILSMRTGGSMMPLYAFPSLPSPHPHCIINFCRFSSAEVQSFTTQLIDVLLAKIGVQNSPERVVENDFCMRCACAFRALHAVSDQCPSQALRELSSQ